MRPFIFAIFFFEMFYEFYALIIAFQGLCVRKGLNKEVRKRIFCRQVLLVIIRIITGLPGNILILNELFKSFVGIDVDE